MSEQIEGRNAVLEAFRSGKCVDKLFILDGCQDGPVRTIAREARKKDTIINYVAKERLDQLSETGAHQGVIAQVAAYEYASVEDILAKAKEMGARVALITINPNSSIANMADVVIEISAPSPKSAKQGGIKSIQPMGSLFEQSEGIFMDIAVMMLMERRGKDSDTMFGRHANME